MTLPVARVANTLPFRRDDLFRPFEQMFDQIVNQFQDNEFKNLKSGFPRLDILHDESSFVIEVAMPGVSPEDVRVEIEPVNTGHSTLHISGKMERTRQDADYYVRELSRRAFRRSVLLPREIKGDPEAVFRNGLLTLSWKHEGSPGVTPIKVISVKTE